MKTTIKDKDHIQVEIVHKIFLKEFYRQEEMEWFHSLDEIDVIPMKVSFSSYYAGWKRLDGSLAWSTSNWQGVNGVP